MPSRKYGEEVGAFIVPKPGFDIQAEDVRDFCRGKISWFKIPKYVKSVTGFPLTASGKIQKFKLREMAAEFWPEPMLLLAGFIMAFTALPTSAVAQGQPFASAEALLDAAAKQSAGIASLSADFVQEKSMGLLALAQHPALKAMGEVIFWGLIVEVPVALWLLPRLCRTQGKQA